MVADWPGVLHINPQTACAVSDWVRMHAHMAPSVACHPPPDGGLVAHLKEAAGSTFDAYNNALQTDYDRTTAIQALVLVGLGDVTAQFFEARNRRLDAEAAEKEAVVVATIDLEGEVKKVACVEEEGGDVTCAAVEVDEWWFDPQRTLRMGFLGLVIGGLGTSHWLQYLEEQLPGHDHWQTIVQKAMLDGCIWAPIANTAYLIFTPLLEGEDLDFVKEKLANRFVPVMIAELSTFLPYNLGTSGSHSIPFDSTTRPFNHSPPTTRHSPPAHSPPHHSHPPPPTTTTTSVVLDDPAADPSFQHGFPFHVLCHLSFDGEPRGRGCGRFRGRLCGAAGPAAPAQSAADAEADAKHGIHVNFSSFSVTTVVPS